MKRILGIVIIIAIMMGGLCVKVFWMGDDTVNSLELLGSHALSRLLGADATRYEQQRIRTETAREKTDELKEELSQAKIMSARNLIPWKVSFGKCSKVGILVVACVGFLLYVGFSGMALVIEKSVHIARVNGAEIPVHHKDLGRIAPAITMMTQAQMIAAVSQQRSFEMVCEANKMLKGYNPPTALAVIPDTAGEVNAVPTFGDMLRQGTVAPGKELIIGYAQDGQPCRSALDDNYSTVVIGQSGTGKSFGEAYSIASTILSYGAFYTILDPHYPDKKKESVGDRLGALKGLDNIRILNNPYRLDEYAAQLTEEFETYMATGSGRNPHIIVVDEHSVWKNSTNGGKAWLKYEERIIYEGRKYGWYLHVTSKSPLAADFGSSAVRDGFATSLIYKVKKQQAQTYYKDTNLVEMVKACDKPGMAVYTGRDDKSRVLHIPRITQQDMSTVVALVKQANGSSITYEMPSQEVQDEAHGVVSVSVPVTQDTTSDTTGGTGDAQEAHIVSDEELLQIMQAKRKEGVSVSDIARDIDFERTYLSKWLNKKRDMTEELRGKLQVYCQGVHLDTAVSTGEAQDKHNVIEAANRFQNGR